MISRTVQLRRGSLHYLEAGHGRPMVLLHAFPLGAAQWLPQLESPPAGWRLIAPDLSGFGASLSSTGLDDVSMDTYASDVVDLLAHLDLSSATVLGLSMGGYVALAMLRRAPDRVAGLVLADTRASADSGDARAARERMVDLVRREGPSGVADAMLDKLLGATSTRQRPELAATVRVLIEANGPDGVEAAIRAMKMRADHTSLLSTISCPTLVVCGAEDVITTPAECEKMCGQIPGARFVRIDGAGHLCNLEAPEEFSRAMVTGAA